MVVYPSKWLHIVSKTLACNPVKPACSNSLALPPPFFPSVCRCVCKGGGGGGGGKRGGGICVTD